jgi:phosphoribosylglycinamide formyltransferase-1
MRLIGPTLIDRFPGRIINVHPALLPSFPGLAAQQQALAYGVKISGCTVHFVNEVMDGGRIIAQTAVPLLEGDTVASLSARILAEEHQLLPLVIGRLAEQIKAEQVSEDGSSQG